MSEQSGGPLLEAKALTKEFQIRGRGKLLAGKQTFRAVDDVSVRLHAGETVGLVGESGSGKSTTARLIARLLTPTSGRLLLDGEDVTTAGGAHLRQLRRAVQFVFQDPFSSLNPRQNVEELVSAPLRYQGIEVKEGVRARVRSLMERVGLDPDHSLRYPTQFSGGQAQRIGIARAIAASPRVVICDEAVSALDVSVQAQVLDLLKDLQRDYGFSYLFIAHDLAVVRQVAHWVCVMKNGQIVEQGDRDHIYESPNHEYTRELLGAVPRIPEGWEATRRSRDGEVPGDAHSER